MHIHSNPKDHSVYILQFSYASRPLRSYPVSVRHKYHSQHYRQNNAYEHHCNSRPAASTAAGRLCTTFIFNLINHEGCECMIPRIDLSIPIPVKHLIHLSIRCILRIPSSAMYFWTLYSFSHGGYMNPSLIHSPRSFEAVPAPHTSLAPALGELHTDLLFC